MIAAGKCFPSSNFSLLSVKMKMKDGKFRPLSAKGGNLGENSKDKQGIFPLRLRLSKVLIPRSAIALFSLGFIDAGYSGDWSRIGVISRETEELLKVAAFLVSPLCLILIFVISYEDEGSDSD